jgi:hypothetical protein
MSTWNLIARLYADLEAKMFNVLKKTNGGKSKMSVGTFVKEYDKGTYIIRVSGHAFTIKDGWVIGNPNDATQLRKVVKNAWKIGS